jgi:tetratricopeptide (TPR) repeat protein
VIKLGMDTKSVIARFEAERQALAMMDHPNIAKVLDAGATDTGRPYFVMDLVRGIKVTEFCDTNKLSTEQRLKLFIQVCQAIQHAHQKGIIHRDIKPSNILVSIDDGVPVPKVIDFGISKATHQQQLTDKTLFTAFEQFLGTPAYVSPEQALMTNLDIDTRTDIYSLGVLLYELLTGRTPFEARELLESGLDAMRRTIGEKEPLRPSTRLSHLAREMLTTTAALRHTAPPHLIHLVRGDLDWIAMKCLEKDRSRRYETANALAADLKRHLDNEPVVARPPTALYRLRKSCRRHQTLFTAGTAVIAALVFGLVALTAGLSRERAARVREEAQRRLADQRIVSALDHVERFLTDDLPKVEGLPGGTHAREGMIRNTVALMDELAPAAADRPEFLLAQSRVHAYLALTQGSVTSLGDPEAGLRSASNALRLLCLIPEDSLPWERVRQATCLVELSFGMPLEAMGRYDEALEHYQHLLELAVELKRRVPGFDASRKIHTARIRLGSALILKKDYDRAMVNVRQLLADPFVLASPDSDKWAKLQISAVAYLQLGLCYSGQEDWDRALAAFQKALDFTQALGRQSGADVFIEINQAVASCCIGRALYHLGKYPEALKILDETLRLTERLVNQDKANWDTRDGLNTVTSDLARCRVAAARALGISEVERNTLLTEARSLYQRCLQYYASPQVRQSKMIPYVPEGEVTREWQELEAVLAAEKHD